MSGRYTRSKLGLVPPDESEFQFRYKFSQTKQQIPSLFSSDHSFQTSETTGDAPRDVIHTDPQFKSPLDFDAIHNDERYDLTTKNIIDQLKRHGALALKYSDFVYCKDYGLYPNNRLIIVRRFSGPVGDNLTRTGGKPIAKVISWFDDTNPPIKIDFGVNWQEAEPNFKTVLNNMGNDLGLNKIMNLGDVAASGFGILPLPGAYEPFTRAILEKLGIVQNASFIPSGSGTLIKEAKVRKLISDDQSGSSLSGKISVTVKCVWEQKFIGGIDPTPVYYDLLMLITHFGSDDASFYAGGGAGIVSAVNKLLKFLQDPVNFVKKILETFAAVVGDKLKEIKKVINDYFDSQIQKIPQDTSSEEYNKVDPATGKSPAQLAAEAEKKKVDAANAATERSRKKTTKLLDLITNTLSFLGSGLANKYKHVLQGVAAALTGAPSTPWHVTVGNPFRPILSSGDMYMSSQLQLTLGPNLAFNDLPSSIELSFTLESARNLGANEIFRKLSTGELRFTSTIPANFYHEFDEKGPTFSGDSTNDPIPDGLGRQEDIEGNLPFEQPQYNQSNVANSSVGSGTTGSVAPGSAPVGQGNGGDQINKDACSDDPVVQGNQPTKIDENVANGNKSPQQQNQQKPPEYKLNEWKFEGATFTKQYNGLTDPATFQPNLNYNFLPDSIKDGSAGIPQGTQFWEVSIKTKAELIVKAEIQGELKEKLVFYIPDPIIVGYLPGSSPDGGTLVGVANFSNETVNKTNGGSAYTKYIATDGKDKLVESIQEQGVGGFAANSQFTI
jgi:hypothetical protein